MGDRVNILGIRLLYVYNDRELYSKGIESLDFSLMKLMFRIDMKFVKCYYGE